jgi:hypothetical protein
LQNPDTSGQKRDNSKHQAAGFHIITVRAVVALFRPEIKERRRPAVDGAAPDVS